MRKLAVLFLVLTIVALPAQPALARGGSHFYGHHRFHHGHGHGHGLGLGLALGLASALVFTSILLHSSAPEPPPPPRWPRCYDYTTQGYWTTVPLHQSGGFVTYQHQWVPGTTQRVCY